MKRGVFFLVLLIGQSCCAAASQPLLVVFRGLAWANSSGPVYVLYSDGTVIFQAPWETGHGDRHGWNLPQYWQTRVEDAEAYLHRIFPYNHRALKPYYSVSAATDQDETSIWIKGRVTRIYGNWWDDHRYDDSPEIAVIAAQQRAALPVGIRNLLENIRTLSPIKCREWLPKRCELFVGEYGYAPAPSIVWPSVWPTWTEAPPETEYFTTSFDFPVSALDELMKFKATIPERTAILMAGRKVALQFFTFELPSESIWQRDFRDAVRDYELSIEPHLYMRGFNRKTQKLLQHYHRTAH